MFKVGDEVLIKGKVGDVDIERDGFPYWVFAPHGMGYWLSEEDITDKTYEKGLADAWELAKKIYHAPCEGGLENREIEEIFDCKFGSVTHKYTAEEALAKIEAYEKEKEIKVGSIVEFIGGANKGVVTLVRTKGDFFVLWDNGTADTYKANELRNTGRTAEGLTDLLRQIGE